MNKSERKTATDIIEEVKNEMCRNFCKYTNESYEHLDQEEVYEKCEECPLNKL